jgi:choline dehydrogenase-like flavoprotein
MVKREGANGWHEASDWNAHWTKQDFTWWRPRMPGGRTSHWGRLALRMGPFGFKPKSRDALGLERRFEYKDIEPWYDKTEALVGVFGSNEGMENTPASLNGSLQPPPHPRAHGMLVRKHAKGLGIPVIPSQMASLTKPLNNPAPCFCAMPEATTRHPRDGRRLAATSTCRWRGALVRRQKCSSTSLSLEGAPNAADADHGWPQYLKRNISARPSRR